VALGPDQACEAAGETIVGLELRPVERREFVGGDAGVLVEDLLVGAHPELAIRAR